MSAVIYAPPVGPKSRHLRPGSEYAAGGTGPNDPVRAGAHAGLDFQPEVRGASEPIDWLVGGTITRIVRNRVQGSRLASLYAYHTGNAVEWAGDDGRVWHYRHMPQRAMKNLAVGQRVEAGDLATHMGTTGNSNGVHLHIGCRAGGRFVDPESILRANNAWPIGWTAPDPAQTTPADAEPEPVQSPRTVDTSTWAVSELSARQIAIKAGYGTEKSTTPYLVRGYQRGQLAPYTLLNDGHWGQITHDHYRWVFALQRAMNRWKGDKLAEDGDFGRLTKARVIDLQRRNLTGAYKAAGGALVDGLPGPIFCKMLGIAPHPNDRK